MSHYELYKDVVSLVLAVHALVTAGGGLDAWRKQVKAKKAFEAFEVGNALNHSLLKIREAIRYVRHPMIWASESAKGLEYAKEKYPHLSHEEIERNAKSYSSYVYEMRWERISDAIAEMETHLLSAEVLWGSGIVDVVLELRKKVTELNIALHEYFDPDRSLKEDYKSLHEVIFDLNPARSKLVDDDKFTKEVEAAVKIATDFIKRKEEGR